jgi:glycerol kinase
VAAIGITNQRETVIVWDRATGEAIHPAIVWQDRRTASFCKELEGRGAAETISAKTGLVIDPYFSATKVKWILDNVNGARARAERGELAFGTVDSWLIWHLTSGHKHVTDVTNASRTLLFNIVKGEWDAELLKLFDIPASILPEVKWSSERVGEVTTTLGLGGVPIAGIAGDNKRRSSASCAGARARPRIPTERDAFCCRTSAQSSCVRSTGLLQPSRRAPRSGLSTRSKAAFLSGARWCSGYATI